MEQFNKALSFILGLVVVVVFIAVASGKINLKGKFGATSTSKAKVTPTSAKAKATAVKQTTQKVQPTYKPATTQKQTTQKAQSTTKQSATLTINPNYHRYGQTAGEVSTIPNTGPELLIPLALSSLFGGKFLHMLGRKKD